MDVNKAFTRMYGFDPQDVIGGSFGDRLSREEVARRSSLIERALAGEQGHLETRTVRKDGSSIDVELRYLPIMHRGEPHVLAVARDITARREAEARRLELEDQVRQAQKMEAIGQLTGGIAHDFNNILTSVIGYLAMAEERASLAADPDTDLVRQLDQAHLAARRARRATELPALVSQSVQLLRATMPSSTIIGGNSATGTKKRCARVRTDRPRTKACSAGTSAAPAARNRKARASMAQAAPAAVPVMTSRRRPAPQKGR